ncbi:MAG TPA: pentapeptide repeat-containing protein, partial [Isosphaeraceae bacterium]
RLDQAVLDHADLREAVALGASLRGASLRGVDAQGASFVRADLSGADLTRAKMGARAYLFTLAGTFAAELDQRPYPQPDLLQAFQAQGSPIAPGAPVAVLAQGKRWQIRDDGGPYLLLLGAVGIDVFWAAADLRPAVLRDATCQGTTAPGASLSGADLRGVRSPEAQEALAWICRVYWYPLYAYIRRRGHAADEARDLTEEFFVRLLEKGFLRTADRDKGRFRAFLLACCKHFLANQRDRDRAAKRGGGRIPLSIDPSAAEPRC